MDLPIHLPPELRGSFTRRALRSLLPLPSSFHRQEDFWCASMDLERALARLAPMQLLVLELQINQGQSEDTVVQYLTSQSSMPAQHARKLIRDTWRFLDAQTRLDQG